MMNNMSSLLNAWPWLRLPLLSNAPMGGIATSELAVAVTCAGGLGQIGFLGSAPAMDQEFADARRKLRGTLPNFNELGVLPIGCGIVCLSKPHQVWSELFAKHKPAMFWLAFGNAADTHAWSEMIRRASPASKVWVQVGSVATAMEVSHLCRPDALVVQGGDAGGHGTVGAASIVSLLPEIADKLRIDGSDVMLLAAGGISDGRGAAAAFALGADGVVMGTRFLVAEEAAVDGKMRREVLVACDGGQATARSRIWDDIWGDNPWPDYLDGRCLKNTAWHNSNSGLTVHEVRQRLQQDMDEGGITMDPKDMMTIWAGTGVGLVNNMEPAADIVKKVREETCAQLEKSAACMNEMAALNYYRSPTHSTKERE